MSIKNTTPQAPSTFTAFGGELKAVVRLAVPVVLAHLGQMAMGVVDTLMLGRVSEADLAAGGLGNSLWIGLLMFPMGVLFALDALVSQAWGAQDRQRIAGHYQRGLLTAFVFSLLLTVPMFFCGEIMALLGQPPEIIPRAGAYVRWLIISTPAALLFVAVRQTLQAMGVVRQAVLAMVVGNLVNVVANYALIFGHFGFPALGVVGSAHATNLSRWVMLAVLVAASWRVLEPYWIRCGALLMAKGYRRLLSLGLPIGFQVSFEMWAFMAVALMMGNLGTRELAAHQIALNMAAITFMVPLGVGGAAATRVGNAIGRGSSDGARRAALVCLALGAGVMSLSAICFYLFPQQLARLYTPEPGVIAVAAFLLPVAALFQVFDGLQVVGMGVLRGTADTHFPAFIALVGYWCLGLPFGWLLAFSYGWGPRGLWLGLTVGLASVALLLLVRIRIRFRGELAALED